MPHHARPRHARTWKHWVAVAAVIAVSMSAGAATGVAWTWRSNVTTLPSVTNLVAAPTPATSTAPVNTDDPWSGRAVNLLLMGSDDRSGANETIGGAAAGMRSDTTLLVHVPADRSRLDVVSIPRDSRADIPACHLDRDVNGPVSDPHVAKFNAAFSTGAATGDLALAAACTISTVQTMTGLTIDGFAIVDFAGFEGMVDAVGGVRVCVPEPLVDGRYTSLNLTAGWHDLTGADALNYVRARHVQGTDGTDLSRIDRQQKFLGALVRKVTSSQVLTSPTKLLSFMNQTTSSLTISDEIDSNNALGLVWGARTLRPADVTFVTAPWAYGQDGYVIWTDQATILWQRLASDTPLVDTAPVEPSAPAAPGTPADTLAPDSTNTPKAEPSTGPMSPVPVLDVPVQTGEDPQEAACG